MPLLCSGCLANRCVSTCIILYTGCQNPGKFPKSTGLPFHSVEVLPEVIVCHKITGEAKTFSAFVKLVGAEVKWNDLSTDLLRTNSKWLLK